MKILRTNLYWVLVAIFISFSACNMEDVPPVTDELNAENSLNAMAEVSKDVYQIDLPTSEWVIFTGCQEEPLRVIEGTLRVHYTVVENGQRHIAKFHYNASEMRVLNEQTGVVYNGTMSRNSTNSYDKQTYYPYQSIFTDKIILTAPGKGGNIIVKWDFHLIYNANGTTTAYINNLRTECD